MRVEIGGVYRLWRSSWFGDDGWYVEGVLEELSEDGETAMLTGPEGEVIEAQTKDLEAL